MSPCRLAFFSLAALLLVSGARLPAGEPAPHLLRVLGPDTLQRASRNLLAVEGSSDGKSWKRLAPDQLRVSVTGAARFVDDPAGRPMNPFEVRCEDVATGEATVTVRSAGLTATRKFAVGAARPAGAFEGMINPGVTTHRFMGLGGGVLFYDNQFNIS